MGLFLANCVVKYANDILLLLLLFWIFIQFILNVLANEFVITNFETKMFSMIFSKASDQSAAVCQTRKETKRNSFFQLSLTNDSQFVMFSTSGCVEEHNNLSGEERHNGFPTHIFLNTLSKMGNCKAKSILTKVKTKYFIKNVHKWYIFISEEKDAIIFHVLKVSCPSRQSSARNEPLYNKITLKKYVTLACLR